QAEDGIRDFHVTGVQTCALPILLLQLSLKLPYKVLYVSGEESQKQIKMRAERINPNNNSCYILTETNTQNIFKQVEEIEPDILIIDSIQTLHTDYIEASAG